MLEEGVEDGEDLDIAVVVDGGLAVGLEVEGVDHVDVAQVRGGGLVGDVDGVLEGEVPDGEGFKLGVAGLDAAAVLLVELGEAGGHLAAARAGGGDENEGARGLDVIVAAEPVLGDDMLDVGGIALNGIVVVGADALGVEPLLEGDGGGLGGPAGQDHGADVEPDAAEGVDEAEGVLVVGDAQVAADLAGLDIVGVDRDEDFLVGLHLQEHLDLAVRLEPGEHAARVKIVEQLAAQLQVELAAELVDAAHNTLRLHLRILLVVKTDFHIVPPKDGVP